MSVQSSGFSTGEFSTEELYSNTLRYSSSIRPWALGIDGEYTGLKFRFQFAKHYLQQREKFNFEKTDYFHFLLNGESFGCQYLEYEGNSSWRYANASQMCRRFQALIDVISINPSDEALFAFFFGKKTSYWEVVKPLFSRVVFETKHPTMVVYNEGRRLRRKPEGSWKWRVKLLYALQTREISADMGLFPVVEVHHGRRIVGNGCHRLAILHALNECQGTDIKLRCVLR